MKKAKTIIVQGKEVHSVGYKVTPNGKAVEYHAVYGKGKKVGYLPLSLSRVREVYRKLYGGKCPF